MQAVFEIAEGLPGNGKSYYSALKTRTLCERNKAWYEKSGVVRHVKTNLRMSEEFEKEYALFLQYWHNLRDLEDAVDCDIVWDEIATEMDSRDYAMLPMGIKRLLSQYDKRGIEIYANTQFFDMIDYRARKFVTRIVTLMKIAGSRRPSATRPISGKVWGLIIGFDVDMSRLSAEEATEKKYFFIPSELMGISEKSVSIYNTRQVIEPTDLPPRKMRAQEFIGIQNGKEVKRWIRFV